MPVAVRDSYARYPRSILWLIPGGRLGGVEVAPFYLSKWPITNEQFEAFDPDYERSPASPDDRGPAVAVSFDQALGYCEWYADVSRKPIRLPTEVEWQYACRGGDPHGCGAGAGAEGDERAVDDRAVADQAWHLDNSNGRHHSADQKRGNGFGVYGMLGGVWEWTQAAGDPGSEEAVLRGGSIRVAPLELSCALRKGASRALCADDIGFRIVKAFSHSV